MSYGIAKRLILIGLDGAMLYLTKKFADERKLPSLTKLMKEGVFGEALPSPPCDTPTNWTTIATGAWTGTHGITSFSVHLPGEPLDKGYDLHPTMNNSRLCQAEFIWNTAEKAGKKCVVMYYPVSWPSTLEKGITIGPGKGGQAYLRISQKRIFSSMALTPASTPIIFIKARKWKNSPRSYSNPLETFIPVTGELPGEAPQAVTHVAEPGFAADYPDHWKIKLGEAVKKTPVYYVLLIDPSGEGYQKVIISRDRDTTNAIVVLRLGAWSDWIVDSFQQKDGNTVEGVFKFKLVALSPDASDFRLYRTDILRAEGWSHPKGPDKEIVKNVGPYYPGLEVPPLRPEWFDEETSWEHPKLAAQLFADTADYLMERYHWDFFFMHYHIHDALNHWYVGYLRPGVKDAEKVEEAWRSYARGYQNADLLIGKLLEKCADDETLTVVISDHAGLPAWKQVWLGGALMRAGLMTYKWDPELKPELKLKRTEEKRYFVDWSRTKVFPCDIPLYIWVNLKGRDPDGIVPPTEYEQVRDKTIDTLYSIRDPETGECPIALALKKEDARYLGQWGERVGDVVLFLKPGYTAAESLPPPAFNAVDPKIMGRGEVSEGGRRGNTGEHHEWLPNAKLGPLSDSAMFLMHGPGLKKGYEREKPINLVDVAPTIAYLLGIPAPAQSEGEILDDLFL